MADGQKRLIADSLKTAFESGYSNAASSLAKMINDNIHLHDFVFGFYNLESMNLTRQGVMNGGSNHLITTELFGDFVGKSYLLMSEHEFQSLTAAVPESKNQALNLKEEYIKELDNILSASVITKVANQLRRKMFGDVPTLIGRVNGKIEDIIYDDFSEQTNEVYVTSVFLTVKNQAALSPCFIWVIDSSSLKEIELQAI